MTIRKRKKVRVQVHLDHKLKGQGFSLSERLAAFDKVKSKRDIATLVALAYRARHERSTTNVGR